MAPSAGSAPRPGDAAYSSLLNDHEARKRVGAAKAATRSSRPRFADEAITSSHSATTMGSKPESSLLGAKERGELPALQRRTRVWWILAFYLPLLVIPWILTCIMNYRPLTASRYIDHTGWIRTKDFRMNEGWQDAIDVMNAVAALLTIPVTSLVVAEASVIWLQRKHPDEPHISLAHFFNIADRGWTDLLTIRHELGLTVATHGHRGILQNLILRAAAFLLLCGLIFPLQQLLIRTREFQVITCSNVVCPPRGDCGPSPYTYEEAPYVAQTFDAQLGLMRELPLWEVKEQVKVELATRTADEPHPGIWGTTLDTNSWAPMLSTIGGIYGRTMVNARDEEILPFWVSLVPNGTATGVLAQHALRLDYNVSCERLSAEDFPDICPGQRPFTASFSANNPGHVNGTEDDYHLRICVPRDYATSPWDNSRDKRTITEEIFLGIDISDDMQQRVDWVSGNSFAIRCESRTTRGYFELGNAFNGFAPQPLLEKYPSGTETKAFNDYEERYLSRCSPLGPVDEADYSDSAPTLDSPEGYILPGPEEYDFHPMKAPGPLALTALALFGNESFFAASAQVSQTNSASAALAMCRAHRVPFYAMRGNLNYAVDGSSCTNIENRAARDTGVDLGWDVADGLLKWFTLFNDTAVARSALGIAHFYACDAVLSRAAQSVDSDDQRTIWTSDGRTTKKPTMALPSMVVLSVLLLVEVLVLLRVAYYAWHTPTWTGTLKSLTVAQLANAMDKDVLPPAGMCGEGEMRVLQQLDGRVGVEVRRDGKEAGEVRRLVHGGTEPVVELRSDALTQRGLPEDTPSV